MTALGERACRDSRRIVAVKIRLKRLGKIRAPYYRIVVADSRTKRDGRVIEEIGKYHPTEEPSFIEVNSERALYWLGVGAQPTEQVTALLKLSGDWGKFKGEKGAKSTIRTKAEPELFVVDEKKKPVLKPKAEKAPAPKAEAAETPEPASVVEPVETQPADEDAAAATGDDLAADVAAGAVEAPEPVDVPAETVTESEVAVDEAEGAGDEPVSNEPEVAAEAEAAAEAEEPAEPAEADKA